MKQKAILLFQLLIAAAAFLAVLLLMVWFFMRIPTEGNTLAMDWKLIRPGVVDWDLTYSPENGLRYPPWSAVLLLPLGQIPLAAGWGVVTFLTILILPLTLPREVESGIKRILGVFALVLAYPTLRTIADGNIEFLILGGLVLLEYGLYSENLILFAAGVLLAATKVQETWILLVFLPLLAGKKWSLRRGAAVVGVLALFILPAMVWKGRDWLLSMVTSPYKGSVMDSALLTVIQRLGATPAAAILAWAVVFGLTVVLGVKYVRGYSREAVGFLTAGSLLLAPYASSNNFIIPYAFGVVPLLLARRREGALLAVLVNLPYLLLSFRDVQYQYSALYWTLVMALAWIFFALRLRSKRQEVEAGSAKIDAGSGKKKDIEAEKGARRGWSRQGWFL